MSTQMILTFVILLVTTIFFMVGRLRSDIVAVGSLLALTLFGIITVPEALSGFSNSIVIMIAGLFIVGGGILHTGLAKQLGIQVLRIAGRNETRLLIMIMVLVAFLSAFISNTGTVAVLLPVVILLANELKLSPAKFLIPLAFASSLGGVLTLIGTPPNLVASQTLHEYGFGRLSFFDFTPIGLIALVTGIIFMSLFGKRLLPQREYKPMKDQVSGASIKTLIETYRLPENIFRVMVPKESSIVGQQLRNLQLPSIHRVNILEIARKNPKGSTTNGNVMVVMPGPNTFIAPSDILYVQGSQVQMQQFCDYYNLEIDTSFLLDHVRNTSIYESLVNKHLGMAEALLIHNSSFIDQTIEETHFREKYDLNVIGINRMGQYEYENVSKMKLRFGDALLVQGAWSAIELLDNDNEDVVVIGKPQEQAKLFATTGKAPIAAMIMVIMLGLMTFEIVSPVIAVLISAMLIVLTGCLRSVDDAYKVINWESVILIAAMLPMATALEKTGGVLFISELFINAVGAYGPVAILAGFYIVTMVFSQFISNTATAVIFAPISITTAISLGVSPIPFLITVAVSASMAFATPVASPTNALVMTAGNYQFRDFAIVGIPLQIVIGIVMIITIPMIYPL